MMGGVGALMDGLAGRVPPNVILMRALMQAASPAAFDAALAEVRAGLDEAGQARLAAVAELWRTHPEAWALVHRVLAVADHGAPAGGDAVAQWARTFDRLAGLEPAGSVALYTLGDPDLLARATAEVVDWLDDRGLLGQGRDAVEIGCGNGRFLPALAERLRSVLGLDVSAGMVEQAQARCAGLPNARAAVSNGRDLSLCATATADLVLGLDVFPYLVIAGESLMAAHLAEIARVLRPGGDLVVLNYSYRGDPRRDEAELNRLAGAARFRPAQVTTGDFTLWDATSFWLKRA